MKFDEADIQTYINTGRFESVVLHETNHAVGFGTIESPAEPGLHKRGEPAADRQPRSAIHGHGGTRAVPRLRCVGDVLRSGRRHCGGAVWDGRHRRQPLARSVHNELHGHKQRPGGRRGRLRLRGDDELCGELRKHAVERDGYRASTPSRVTPHTRSTRTQRGCPWVRGVLRRGSASWRCSAPARMAARVREATSAELLARQGGHPGH